MEGLLGKSISSFLSQPRQQDPEEIIATLCNRLLHSTNLEDRRAAVLGLRGFSRDYQEIVGRDALEALTATIKRDFHDPETLRAALETLLIVFMYEDHPSPSARIALQKLRDAFMKVRPFDTNLTQDNDNVLTLLDCLESPDFYSRLYSLQLLSNLLKARTAFVQKCLLSSPLGISRLVASLSDNREAVRNETLLVLIALTEGNPEIQKLVAFENVFEILFAIIEQEGGVDGGIVVQDCLQLLNTLLRYNSSNQNYFRETRGVQRLVGMFPSGDNAGHWPPQRSNNTILSMVVTRLLIPKGGAGTVNNQEALAQGGAINKIIDLALSLDPPSTVSAAALLACADLLRGNYKVQAYFSTYLVLSGPLPPTPETSRTSTPSGHRQSPSHKRSSSQQPQIPVLDALIAMSLTSAAPYTYDQRLAACRCIQGFIYSNPEGREGLLQRLINAYHTDTSDPPKPSNLLYYIFNLTDSQRKDPYRIWFACIILLHLLDSSPKGKELMRSFSIGDTASGEEAVTALQQINANLSTCLINSYNPRIAVGYLMLLSIWVYDDPSSVIEFLEETAGVHTLVGAIAQAQGIFVTGLAAVLLGICVEFNTPNSPLPPVKLQKLITSGVGGKDQFVFRITQLREAPEFRDFREQVTFSSHADDELPDLWFDLGFVEFLKDNYSTALFGTYLILGRIQRSLERSPDSYDAKQNGIVETSVSQDQSKYVNSLEIRLRSSEADVKSKEADILGLKTRLDKQTADHAKELGVLTTRTETAEGNVAKLKAQLEESESKAKTLQSELDELFLILGDIQEKQSRYKEKIKGLGGEVTDDDEDEE